MCQHRSGVHAYTCPQYYERFAAYTKARATQQKLLCSASLTISSSCTLRVRPCTWEVATKQGGVSPLRYKLYGPPLFAMALTRRVLANLVGRSRRRREVGDIKCIQMNLLRVAQPNPLAILPASTYRQFLLRDSGLRARFIMSPQGDFRSYKPGPKISSRNVLNSYSAFPVLWEYIFQRAAFLADSYRARLRLTDCVILRAAQHGKTIVLTATAPSRL